MVKTSTMRMTPRSVAILKLLKARYGADNLEDGFRRFVTEHEPTLIHKGDDLAREEEKLQENIRENSKAV